MDKKDELLQINILIPLDWKEHLEQVAREKAAEEKQGLSWHDMIRRATQQVYNLTPMMKIKNYNRNEKQ